MLSHLPPLLLVLIYAAKKNLIQAHSAPSCPSLSLHLSRQFTSFFSLSWLYICLFASVNGFNLFSPLLVIQSPQPPVCFYYTWLFSEDVRIFSVRWVNKAHDQNWSAGVGCNEGMSNSVVNSHVLWGEGNWKQRKCEYSHSNRSRCREKMQWGTNTFSQAFIRLWKINAQH